MNITHHARLQMSISTMYNLPYEQIGKNDPVCIADEVPFEIPDSWEWVRLSSIGEWGAGATPSKANPEYYQGDIPWLKTGDLNDGYIDTVPGTISELALEKTSVKLNPVGSVLIAMYGATIGKLGILNIAATTNQACCACFPFHGMFNKYLFYFLLSQRAAFIKRGEGGAQPNISKEKIVSTLMPLPPLSEQYRIVEKIDRLIPFVERYRTTEDTLTKVENTFPAQLKKSILQQAVQGKLVPQDPEDEPASILLERIRAEKEQLIRSGKIKRGKHESVIYRRDKSHYEKIDGVERCIDDEIPFEIPDGWEWVRISAISSVVTKGTTPRGGNAVYSETGVGFLRAENVAGFDELNLDNLKYIDEKTHNGSLKRSILYPNDVLVTIAGTLGRTAIVKERDLPLNANQAISIIRFVNDEAIDIMYFVYALNSSAIQATLTQQKKITAIPNLTLEIISNCLFPLPPLSEQKRIIEKMRELLPTIDTL